MKASDLMKAIDILNRNSSDLNKIEVTFYDDTAYFLPTDNDGNEVFTRMKSEDVEEMIRLGFRQGHMMDSISFSKDDYCPEDEWWVSD